MSGPPWDWVVTDHAAARYRDRVGAPSKAAASRAIRELLTGPLTPLEGYRDPHVLAADGTILVLSAEKRRVVTVLGPVAGPPREAGSDAQAAGPAD